MKIFKTDRNITVSIFILLLMSFALLSLGFSSVDNGLINQGLFQHNLMIKNDSSDVIDDDDLKITFEKLNKELKRLDGIKVNIKINNKEIKEKLKRLKESSFFDSDKIEEMVKNIQEEIDNHQFDVDVNFDFEKLNESLNELMSEMKEMNIDMSNLKEEMKKLKSFLKELKSELIEDGYIDNEDEDFDLEFTKDKLIVNGEELPENLLEKYKEIYKKHYYREIDGKFRMKK